MAFPTSSWSIIGIVLSLLAAVQPNCAAQEPNQVAGWAIESSYSLQILQNIVYQKTDYAELKLDVIRDGSSIPRPVVLFFHGGGWVQGSKDTHILKLLPFLAWGMDAVNVEYRLASQGLAPAAVEDGRCALHWVAAHAAEYGFDLRRIVIAGESAGGHLALMTGMLRPGDGFDAACELTPDQWAQHGGPSAVKVAAIVNFFGPTDLEELAQPPYTDNFVLRWLGNRPDRIEVARRLSPINYVRPDVPPIITIHGEEDNIVPYDNASRLHEALDRAAAINQLVTIHGGHGGYAAFPWTREQNSQAYVQVREFLSRVGIFAPGLRSQSARVSGK